MQCPKCFKPLNKENNSYKCQNNHCYDISKEGYINLETLVANLGSAKEDVKVTLTATATNGEASQEVKVEVTIKYVKGEIAE